jgi:hypothetical protein
MRKCALAAGAVVLLSLAVAAFAQTPPPDNLAMARQLVVTMRAADNVKAILPQIAKGLKPVIVQNRPEVERDYDAIMPVLLDSMSGRMNELIDQIAMLYARAFSAKEMQELNAFYQTETGQKLINSLPQIAIESMQIGQRFGQAVAAELQDRIASELRKRGHKI